MAINLSSPRTDAYLILKNALEANKVTGSVIVNSFPQKDPAFPAVILPMVNKDNEPPITVRNEFREYPLSFVIEFYVQQKDKQSVMAQVVDAAEQAMLNLDEDNLEFQESNQTEIELMEVMEEPFYYCTLECSFKLTI